MNKKIISVVGVTIFFITLFVILSPRANAFSIGDIVDSVKNFFSPSAVKKEITVNSNISLSPEGDVNKNGVIDAGDTVVFSYVIKNMTDNDYPFATLKTNVPRNELNYVHNIKGAFSTEDRDGSTNIPNLYVHAQQAYHISFEATINFFAGSDKKLDTQAQLIDKQNNKIIESDKIEKDVEALTKDEMQKLSHQDIQINK